MPISNSSQSQASNSSHQVNSTSVDFPDDNPIIILSTNLNRKGVTLYNNSSADILIDVSANYFYSGSYMLALPVKGFYEMAPNFTGVVAAKAPNGTSGSLLVREFE